MKADEKCPTSKVRTQLKSGKSESPHGGFGFLHHRNVLSNYLEFSNTNELGRDVMPWMFNESGMNSVVSEQERSLSITQSCHESAANKYQC